jgi:ring-1,2-phenylacetyl-CoA epoxidase subunit PaaE
MSKYHSIEVKRVIRETPDAVSIEFNIPKELHEIFKYKAGQHLSIKYILKGEELRRNYSLCSLPTDGWKIAIKQIEGGRFSTFANHELKSGDVLQVIPPTGHFTVPFQEGNNKFYVAFAAGSGITPVISVFKEGLRKEPMSRFLLIYGNKRQETIMFRDELLNLKNQYVGRFSLFNVLSQEKLGSDLQEGRINKTKCRMFAKSLFQLDNVDQFLLCGPEEMVFSVRDELLNQQVSKEKIKFELFTTTGIKRPGARSVEVQSKREKVKSAVEILMDGNSFSFNLSSTEENVLDAAIAAGADLPFSCKGGVCSTCKAKLLKGEVDMDVNYALEPDELANGYILTCQAHPKTNILVIDYDQ